METDKDELKERIGVELSGLSRDKLKEVLNFIRHIKLEDDEEILSLSVETAIAEFWDDGAGEGQ